MVLHPLEIPLRHAWTIAHGTRTVQRNLVVELVEGEHRGYGETASIPYFGVTTEDLARLLEGVRGLIERTRWREPAELWAALDPHLPGPAGRFALCAVDEAAHDLWGRRAGRPTGDLLSEAHPGLVGGTPASDYTIGMAAPDVMAAKLREYPGFPVYKVKVGAGCLSHDLALLQSMRDTLDRLGSAARLRVDANCAWTADAVAACTRRLADLGVEFLEQPLPRDAPAAEHAAARAASILPVIADESCINPGDVAACDGLFDGINIKLTKCGGMTPALEMVADARARGLLVMMGCMTETTVGISAIAQLLPFLDFVDMDGALLLAHDVADGARVVDGVAHLPDRPGHGIRWRGPLDERRTSDPARHE